MLKFRTKIFLVVLVSFGVLVGAVVSVIQGTAGRVAEQTARHSLEESRAIIFRRMESRYAAIRETAMNFARDGRIRPEIYASQTATLQDLSEEFSKSLAFDILMFANEEGAILARSDDPEAAGYSVGRSPLYRDALEGRETRGLMGRGDHLLQMVVVPVYDNTATDLVRGLVALAYRIDEELVREIKALTSADMMLYSFPVDEHGKETAPRRFLATKDASEIDALVADASVWQSVLAGEREQARITLNGEDYLGLYIPLRGSTGSMLGFALALRSHDELMAPFLRIRKSALLTGAACIFAASLLAFFIAGRLTAPLTELVDVTARIEEGVYPESKATARRDEIGVLYNAVYRMGRKLKEREELESYLAGLAEEESIVEGKKVARPPGPVGSDEITLVDAANASDSYRPMPADTSSLTVSSEKHLRDSGAELLNDGARIADRYIVRRVLGAGAMGIVYLAYDEVLDESVALKMINTAKVSTKAVDLLKQETKLCRRISHPNILRNHDFGFEGTQCFISMEFVVGQSLFNLIKDHGPLDVRMGLVLARQMCSAVAAAHREGVVHRDLKPQNMMITRRGVLKVMDFGIAFPAEHVEQSKMVAGTPAFMAPEQFSGQGVDHRCDIYAMGVILFYIFSGRYPFRNRHTESTAEARAAEAIPDVRTFNATVPEAIWSIMRTAMDPLREKRYQSAGEMLVDLGRAGI